MNSSCMHILDSPNIFWTNHTLRYRQNFAKDVILEQWRAEAAGCPGPTRFLDALENSFYSSRKISDNLLLLSHLSKFVTFSHQLSNFTKIRSLDAPSSAASCPSNEIFLFFSCHLPTFFLQKLAPWMPPRVDARGRHTVRTPFCTPLSSEEIFVSLEAEFIY